MSYALPGRHFGHPGSSHHEHHPGDGWKFGAVALSATVAGAIFLDSQLFSDPQATDAPMPTVSITLVTTTPLESAVVIDALAQPGVVPPASVTESAIPAGAQAASQPVAPVAVQAEAPTPAAIATRTQPAADIRSIDPAALPGLQALATQLAGHIDPKQVIYTDLTGDALDEAVVMISSDGTYGNLAFVVYTERNGTPEAIFTRLAGQDRRGPSVAVDHGQLVETRAVYGPSDPNSSPSQLVKRYFLWDGQNLVVDRTETTTLPNSKLAD